MTQTKNKSLRVTKEIIERREADREARKEVIKAVKEVAEADTAVLSIIKSQRKSPPKFQPLFQDNPDNDCMYTKNKNKVFKNYSHTNSRESQQNGAWREMEMLKRNGRIPTKHVVLRFQFQFKIKYDMTDLLRKISRYLGDHGIVAAVALEGTKDENGKPSNKVHCHFLIDDKDAPFSKNKLLALFVKACKLHELERGKDVKIGEPRKLPEDFTFDYFVKIGKHGKSIPLFQRGLYIRKFRYIGGWFIRSKKDLWIEYKQEREKEREKKKTVEAALKSKTPIKKSTTRPVAKESMTDAG